MSETFDLLFRSRRKVTHIIKRKVYLVSSHTEKFTFSTLMAEVVSLVTEAVASTFMWELVADSGDSVVLRSLFPINGLRSAAITLMAAVIASICLIRFSAVRLPVEAN